MSYRLNGIPNKIFKEFSDHPKIYMEPQKILNCQSYLGKRKEKLMAPPGQFQNILQIGSNQNSTAQMCRH